MPMWKRLMNVSFDCPPCRCYIFVSLVIDPVYASLSAELQTRSIQVNLVYKQTYGGFDSIDIRSKSVNVWTYLFELLLHRDSVARVIFQYIFFRLNWPKVTFVKTHIRYLPCICYSICYSISEAWVWIICLSGDCITHLVQREF